MGIYSPMRGMEDAAGGVDSARSSSRTKNATKMFIPATEQWHVDRLSRK